MNRKLLQCLGIAVVLAMLACSSSNNASTSSKAPGTEQAVADITSALRHGALTALPAVRFPLDEIDAAHEAVRGHAVGKVLVDIP